MLMQMPFLLWNKSIFTHHSYAFKFTPGAMYSVHDIKGNCMYYSPLGTN